MDTFLIKWPMNIDDESVIETILSIIAHAKNVVS